MHVTPIKYSGKLLDIFCLVEEELVDHLLLGLIMCHKLYIQSLPNESQILVYFKDELLDQSLGHDTSGSYLLPDSLEKFLKTHLY